MATDHRARDPFIWIKDLRRDMAYGVRALVRTRSFTAVAMITLALGIGAVTVIYSVLRNVVLDPFPYSRSERLVNVLLKDANGRIIRGPYFAAPEYLDYQQQAQVFEDVVGTSRQGVHWIHEEGAEALVVAWMTPNGFDFLGVSPLIGRPFNDADAAPGAPPVGVMNYRAWMKHFGGDPNVLGRTMNINGEARTVIGVMPPRFEWNIADLWLPAAITPADDPRSPRGFRAFQAHLRPGVTPREAEAQLNVIGKRRAAAHPADYPEGFRFEVIAVVDWVVRDFRAVLYTLFGAVSLLLVIACCNVANMLLARATAREREIAIRVALGASRGRIVRQLLVESALLAAGGLVLGAGLAYSGIAALARYMPRQGVPWETQIRLDEPVLLFAVVAAAIATIGVGLYPALQSVRQDVVAGAGMGGRTTAGRRQTRMRGGLVVAQVALSIVLLLGAGVLMRTFVKLVNADFGFDTRNLFVAGAAFPARQTPVPTGELIRFYRDTLERLRTIPDVRSVAIANYPPPFGGMSSPLVIPGATVPPQTSTTVSFSSEGLADTIGLRVLRGRYLSQLDVERAHRVAVVNETLARQFFGGQDPLGRTLQLPRLSTMPVPIADPTFTIIGVIGDTANQGPRYPARPQLYVPFTLRDTAGLAFVLRTSSDPLRVLASVRQHVKAIRADVALVEPNRLEDMIQQAFYARPRFVMLILGIFAAAGLLLVACGIYGVLAYMVSQQTREIAIRMALGGERRDVMRMVLRFGLQLVAVGTVLGLAASVMTNRLLATQLWNISAHDPATFGIVIAMIVIIALIACWMPAQRAVRVEPMVALRHE
jgi:putative ABC transport system permease protein